MKKQQYGLYVVVNNNNNNNNNNNLIYKAPCGRNFRGCTNSYISMITCIQVRSN